MAGLVIAGQTGLQALQDGASTPPRLIRTGELGVSEIHGRFYEQCYRGNLYSIGNVGTALSANSITLTATTTPILGVWNPATSPVNLVILQASLQLYINTLTAPVGAGPLFWAASIGNTALSAGAPVFSRRTLSFSGSQAAGFSGGNALTGLTNNVVKFDAADFTNATAQTYGTIVAPTSGTTLTSFGGVQNFDGSLIVPPGGVLALLNANSTTTMNAVGRLLWEEVAL